MPSTNFKKDLVTIATSKRRRQSDKRTNITDVRETVEARDGEACRIVKLLERFGFRRIPTRLELAHYQARGMGGNSDLSRDTVENTLMVAWDLHNLGRHSMHGRLIQITPLTEQGTSGPIAVTFYEESPKTAKEGGGR